MTLRAPLALVPVVFLAAGCHARPESLVPASARARGAATSDHLRGEPECFVVLGDATSFAWPAMLQDLLDAHARRRGLYRVLNAAAPETGVVAWADGEPNDPSHARVKELVRAQESRAQENRVREKKGGTPIPRTALCVVSLKGLSDEDGPVKSENDMVGAEMGADALEKVALELRELGHERIVFATPLFSGAAGPERGLERVALERLLARGHDFVAAGPDVFRVSRRYFPDAYEEDGAHPNEFGVKLVAEEWYRWLAGPEAREDVVEGLYARDYDVEAIEADHARNLAPD